jgi:hypothetical protein
MLRTRPQLHAALRAAAGLLLALGSAAAVALAEPAGSGAAPPIDFNRDVRPILSDRCFACHGPDAGKRKAKLRLDQREIAVEKQAIVPGDAEASELVYRIFSEDPEEHMPPPESRQPLTLEQKEILRRWIDEGAEYQAHWSYLPLEQPAVPAVKRAEWLRTPVDAFVLRRLEEQNLPPAAAASRRDLLRRLSLDLTGLPPSPEEMSDFLADRRPDAYERQVERLLASPHYGERMAVLWLDLARYADTVGYHGDQGMNAFPYRDYVIDSFNANKPFDQFTVEQIAGDLLAAPTEEQLIATGFNRLNMVTREGGAQPKEYLAKHMADRVRTVSAIWLGSTMGCAECHDHKFDPFTTKDFYQLGAFFADLKQWGVYQDYDYTPNPDLRGWSNDHPFPPELEVDNRALRQRMVDLRRRIDAEAAAMAAERATNPALAADYDSWTRAAADFVLRNPDGWEAPAPEVLEPLNPAPTEAAPTPEPVVQVQDNRAVLLTGADKTLKLRLPLAAGPVAAIRVELLPHEKHGGSIIRGGSGQSWVTLAAKIRRAADGAEQAIAFHHAEADRKDPVYFNGAAVLGVRGGWLTSGAAHQNAQTAVWLLDAPLAAASGDLLEVTLYNSAAGCVRVSVSPFAAESAPPQGALPGGAELQRLWLFGSTTSHPGSARARTLLRRLQECRGGKAMTVISVPIEPKITRVLPRGNWQDETGEVVEPAPPHFLPQPAPADGVRLTRLDLAHWLVSSDNPLAARAFANLLWKQFFGAGLAPVPDDLGSQGDWPSHPELLDWLAADFRDDWDVKDLVRQMVLSAAYQQESAPRPELLELDPHNRLLARQTPRRLEAEFVRDNALFVAGLLNEEVGGPSAHPYQQPGYYAPLQFPDREYQQDSDERQWRRGVYTHWQRTFLQPMLANFDAPSRDECTASRVNSNTPQQALTLLNDPSFVEAARALAQHLLTQAPDQTAARLDAAFARALGRPASAAEQDSLQGFLSVQLEEFRADPARAEALLAVGIAPQPPGLDAVELAAWTCVCRVILNLHESVTRF